MHQYRHEGNQFMHREKHGFVWNIALQRARSQAGIVTLTWRRRHEADGSRAAPIIIRFGRIPLGARS